MGTNFYLRKVKPREVHDEYHIAKRSSGWKIHFQDSSEYSFEPSSPSYHSVDDIVRHLESGEYQLSDENGNVWAPGEESLGEFMRLCGWNGGSECDGKPCSRYPDGNPPYYDMGPRDYRDPQGYIFTPDDFR